MVFPQLQSNVGRPTGVLALALETRQKHSGDLRSISVACNAQSLHALWEGRDYTAPVGLKAICLVSVFTGYPGLQRSTHHCTEYRMRNTAPK